MPPMNTVVQLLLNTGWRREKDYTPTGDDKGSAPRQILSVGQRRAYIGPKFVTFYTKVQDVIEDIHSVRIEDTVAITRMARHPEPVTVRG